MKIKILTLIALAWLATASAQTLTNYDFTTVHTVSGVTIVGDTPLVAFTKTWNNFLYLFGLSTNNSAAISQLQTTSISNATATAATLGATNAPVFTLTVTNGNLVGYMAVPYQAPYTNAVIPSNSWAASYSSATNALAAYNFATAKDLSSNGSQQLWKVWNSNGVFVVTPQ